LGPLQIVTRFVDATNARNWSALEELVAVDFVRHSCAAGQPEVRSCADLVSFLKQEFATFPDAREEILDTVTEGCKVAVRHSFRGTQLGSLGSYSASGRIMDSQYLAIYLVRDGRIREAWVEWDNLAGLKQLGHL
jgi:steroid delta-isomerase-like uncharacterized protein